MNPGATTRPAASMVRLASAPAYLPTPTILPSCTATSAINPSSPVPSTTRPFLIKRSYAMLLSPGSHLRRDNVVSVLYAEELNSTKSSVSLQRTDRHGILGQKSSDFQRFL